MLQHPAVLITIPEWEEKYGTKSYAVDVQEGYIYALKGEDWERLLDRAYVATDEPLDSEYKTPTEKELTAREVQSLDSKEKVPVAESTRKDVKEGKDKSKSISNADFLESEPRKEVPSREIETPRRKLSFAKSSSDEDTTEAIDREIKETEKAQQELEIEKMNIEKERVSLEKERQRIAEERLRTLRKQRKRLEESIMKMTQEMIQDVELTTEDRKQRRINLENEYLNQIDLEEAAVDNYFPEINQVEEILPDVMTTDSQISSTVDPIEFMDEEALMRLKLKQMRAEQCRTRTHKMYKLFLESETDPRKKQNLEYMLLATINNLDRKMSKFKEGLDDYDQKEQYVLTQTEKLQIEQERAIQEHREMQGLLEGLQEKHRVAREEIEALQKEKDESDQRKKEMEEKIDYERKAKIWREQRLEEKELQKMKREKGSLKGENEDEKKKKEDQDRILAERLAEKEKRDREIRDKHIAEQLQKRQRLERDEQEKILAEQLLERERQEEEEMMEIKREQEQLDREELLRLEREKEIKLTKDQEKLQKLELDRLAREHQKTLEKERKEREKKAHKRLGKPSEEEQQLDKESLFDAVKTVVNGHKPRKPKDLGWDYQKDREAKRVFERKKELQRMKDEEKEKKEKLCPECRYPKHPGKCPCKICGKKGHETKDCPKSKPPEEEKS